MIKAWHSADPVALGAIIVTVVANYDPDRPGYDRAECTVAGRHFAATSYTGAIHTLCRLLRECGIPDGPWIVPGRIKGGSIYWMADRSAVDTATGIRTQRFNPYPAKTSGGQQGGAGGSDGETPPEAA